MDRGSLLSMGVLDSQAIQKRYSRGSKTVASNDFMLRAQVAVAHEQPEMTSTKVRRPRGAKVYARLGNDHALGFYVEIYGLGPRPKVYDAVTAGYDGERPLWGALMLLVEHRFFTREQLDHALEYRELGGRKPRSKGALIALAAIAAMKAAADL